MEEWHSYWTKQIIIQKWTQFFQMVKKFSFLQTRRCYQQNRQKIPLPTSIDNSRTGLDTSKNQCSAPAVTALKNYWRYHVYNLFRLKNSSNVFAFIIIIIGCLTGNIIHDQLKLRPCFLPWVSKNRRYWILIRGSTDLAILFLLLNLEAWNFAGEYKIENK